MLFPAVTRAASPLSPTWLRFSMTLRYSPAPNTALTYLLNTEKEQKIFFEALDMLYGMELFIRKAYRKKKNLAWNP